MTCGQNAIDKKQIHFKGTLSQAKGCGHRFSWRERIKLTNSEVLREVGFEAKRSEAPIVQVNGLNDVEAGHNREDIFIPDHVEDEARYRERMCLYTLPLWGTAGIIGLAYLIASYFPYHETLPTPNQNYKSAMAHHSSHGGFQRAHSHPITEPQRVRGPGHGGHGGAHSQPWPSTILPEKNYATMPDYGYDDFNLLLQSTLVELARANSKKFEKGKN